MKDYTLRELRNIQSAYESMLIDESVSSDIKFSSDMKFKFVDEWDAKRIISSISRRTDNRRMNVEQFRKYYKDPKKRWFGVFEKGKCMALSVLKRTPQKDSVKDIILLAEIQSIVKGYGKPLVEELIRRYGNLWWAADPDGGKELLEYYRQFEVMTEFKVGMSGWTGKPQSFFYKSEDSVRRKMIVDLLKSVECKGKKEKRITFPEHEVERLSKKEKGERFYTTRVSDDYSRFDSNDILSLPWKDKRGYVTRVWDFKDLNDHPFLGELTEKEKDFLGKYKRIKVLEIQVID